MVYFKYKICLVLFEGNKMTFLKTTRVRKCLLTLLFKSSAFVWLIMGLAMVEIESDDKTEE